MFGMSVFQSVLERLKAEETADAVEEPLTAYTTVSGLNAGFVGNLSLSRPMDTGAVNRAYFDLAGEEMLAPPKPVLPPVMPDHLRRITPQDIAADLGLTDSETIQGLAEKRRRFAAENHPDLHAPAFRANATTRMKIANMIIDEALRRLRPIRNSRNQA